MDLCWQSNVSAFQYLSRLVITFLPRRKCLLISWLQSPSAVIWDINEPEITRGEAWWWTAGYWALWRFMSLTLISSRKVLEQPGQQSAFTRGYQPAFLIFYMALSTAWKRRGPAGPLGPCHDSAGLWCCLESWISRYSGYFVELLGFEGPLSQ